MSLVSDVTGVSDVTAVSDITAVSNVTAGDISGTAVIIRITNFTGIERCRLSSVTVVTKLDGVTRIIGITSIKGLILCGLHYCH